MENLTIKFKTQRSISGRPNLEGSLDLCNDSVFPDRIVAKGLRGFLNAYLIGYTPLNKGLIARCCNSYGGRRQVSIFPPSKGKIWLVAPKENTPRRLCEYYKLKRMWNQYAEITSKDADYNIKIG